MLTAYLDESSDDRVYVVAGLMTTEETWKLFSPEWDAALKTPPKISHFKMHGVFTPKANGVFKNYPTQQRIDKTESLIKILNTHLFAKTNLAGSVVMDVRAYKSMLEPALGQRYRNPYLWCFHGILI